MPRLILSGYRVAAQNRLSRGARSPASAAGRRLCRFARAEQVRRATGNKSAETTRRVQLCGTAQRGEAATTGPRVCDPQELCPPRVLTDPTHPSLSACCGSQSRAPPNRRGPRRFGQLLIDCKSALRALATL